MELWQLTQNGRSSFPTCLSVHVLSHNTMQLMAKMKRNQMTWSCILTPSQRAWFQILGCLKILIHLGTSHPRILMFYDLLGQKVDVKKYIRIITNYIEMLCRLTHQHIRIWMLLGSSSRGCWMHKSSRIRPHCCCTFVHAGIVPQKMPQPHFLWPTNKKKHQK